MIITICFLFSISLLLLFSFGSCCVFIIVCNMKWSTTRTLIAFQLATNGTDRPNGWMNAWPVSNWSLISVLRMCKTQQQAPTRSALTTQMMVIIIIAHVLALFQGKVLSTLFCAALSSIPFSSVRLDSTDLLFCSFKMIRKYLLPVAIAIITFIRIQMLAFSDFNWWKWTKRTSSVHVDSDGWRKTEQE